MNAQASTQVRSTPRTIRESVIEYRTFTFWTLVTAQSVSALYQLYRSTIMEAPQYDAFGTGAVIGYAVLFGFAFLARLGKRWTWWLTLLSTTALNLFGIFVYYPQTTTARRFGLIDWTEGVVYVGLLFVAATMSALNLAAVTLAPDKEPV